MSRPAVSGFASIARSSRRAARTAFRHVLHVRIACAAAVVPLPCDGGADAISSRHTGHAAPSNGLRDDASCRRESAGSTAVRADHIWWNLSRARRRRARPGTWACRRATRPGTGASSASRRRPRRGRSRGRGAARRGRACRARARRIGGQRHRVHVARGADRARRTPRQHGAAAGACATGRG